MTEYVVLANIAGMMDVSEVIERAGGVVKLAAIVNRHHATILGWKRAHRYVPPQHVPAISAAIGIPRYELRSDLWEPPSPPGSKLFVRIVRGPVGDGAAVDMKRIQAERKPRATAPPGVASPHRNKDA